jgi:hypothetical protein
MKTGLFLSAASGLMLLGSTAVFAQSAAPADAITLKPGQTEQSANAPSYAPSSDTGLVSLKPGETVNTANAADFGSVTAGATAVEPNAGQPAG